MKKYFITALLLFTSFAIISCGDTTTVPTTAVPTTENPYKDMMETPSNLTFNGTVLSWDAVSNAEEYVVYVDGVETATVTENSYDFTTIANSGLKFQVVTKAPRGYLNSEMSLSLVYVSNPAQAIAAMELVLSDLDSVPEGFAEELVSKGMLSTEAQSLIDAIDRYIENSYSEDTVSGIYTLIDDVFDELDNVEAMISALVKTVLVPVLEEEIVALEDRIEIYEEYIEEQNENFYWNSEYYENSIVQMRETIQAYESLISSVESNPDEIILSVTKSVEYIISIEELISTDLLTYLDGLLGVNDVDDLNTVEMDLILNEFSAILRDSKPSDEDLMVMAMLQGIMNEMYGIELVDIDIDNLSAKQAAYLSLEFDSVIEFIDSIDKEFFDELVLILDEESDRPYELRNLDIGMLFLEYFYDYYHSNSNLFDQINSIYTEEEMEILFNSKIEYSTLQSGSESIDFNIIENITYAEALALQNSLSEQLDVIFDYLLGTNGLVIENFIISSDFVTIHYSYSDESEIVYKNGILDEEYDSYEEFNLTMFTYNFNAIADLVELLALITDEMTLDNYNIYVNILIESIEASLLEQIESGYATITEADVAILKASLEAVFTGTSDEQLQLFKNLINTLDSEDICNNLAVLAEENLDDYTNYNDYYDEDISKYQQAVVLLSFYDTFMDETNEQLLDTIIEEVFDQLSNEDVYEIMELTIFDVNDLQAAINNLLDDLETGSTESASMDYDNMSPADKDFIDSFLDELEDSFYDIN